LKKLLLNLLLLVIPAAIIAWLVRDAIANQSFSQMWQQPKRWDLLALATVCCFLATITTIVRWHYLVRAIDLPLRMRDTIRLGFLGYMWNFVFPGGVGGDFVKAVFLAREQPGRKTEATLTVIVDRLIGLYGLFLLATIASLLTGMFLSESMQVRFATHVMFYATGIMSLGLFAAAMPNFSQGPIARRLHNVPKIGPFIERVNRALRMYYRHWAVLPLATLMTLVAQSLFAIGIWLVARALLDQTPTLGEHFAIVPMAMITGVLPLAPNGLGTFEALVDWLYRQLSPSSIAAAGFIVSIGYRLITVLIAAVGGVIYFANRREMSEIVHEAEIEAQHPEESEAATLS
jgi:uncharacterized protein (TIRG00374 family)